MSKKRRRSNFREKVNQDRERRKKQASSYGYLNLPKGVTVFKEEEGRMKLDVIPYEVTDEKHMDGASAPAGELWYKKPIRIHRNIGVDNDTVICLTTFGKKCPICEYRKKMIKDGADKEDIKALNYSVRNLYNVIPIGHKKFEQEIHVWDIAYGNFQKELDKELEENPDNAIFPDLEEGLTIRARFSEETIFKNKYYECGRIDFDERKEQYDEDILDDSVNLDEILKVLSYKELEDKFLENEDSPDDDEVVDDPPERKRKKDKDEDDDDPKPNKRHSQEDDDKGKGKFKRTHKEEKKKNKCPHGYEFGVDNDKYDECEDCKVFDDCDDKREELEEDD